VSEGGQQGDGGGDGNGGGMAMVGGWIYYSNEKRPSPSS